MPYKEPRLKPPPRDRTRAPVNRPQPEPAPDLSSSSDDDAIEATPFFAPKPRPPPPQNRAPPAPEVASARDLRNAGGLNTPQEEAAARAFIAEAAPWLIPGKVVKPPHLDADAPPAAPFTVPKPVLIVPPEDAQHGFQSPEAFYGRAQAMPPAAPDPEDVVAAHASKAAVPSKGWWWEREVFATLQAPPGAKRVLALHDATDAQTLCGHIGLDNVVYLRGPGPAWFTKGDENGIEHALRGVLAFIKTHGPFQALLGVGQAAQIVVGLSAKGVCKTLVGTNPTWQFVIPVHAIDEDLDTINALVKRLRGQKHALSIFWRSGWIERTPALSVIGLGDAGRRDAALRVSRLFQHNTNAAHRGALAVPADAREDAHFRGMVDGFLVQPFLC